MSATSALGLEAGAQRDRETANLFVHIQPQVFGIEHGFRSGSATLFGIAAEFFNARSLPKSIFLLILYRSLTYLPTERR